MEWIQLYSQYRGRVSIQVAPFDYHSEVGLVQRLNISLVWPHEMDPWFHSGRGKVETLDVKYKVALVRVAT